MFDDAPWRKRAGTPLRRRAESRARLQQGGGLRDEDDTPGESPPDEEDAGTEEVPAPPWADREPEPGQEESEGQSSELNLSSDDEKRANLRVVNKIV